MRAATQPWFWASAALAFGATVVLTGTGGAGGLLVAALTFASFSALVGLGQMAVITMGPGNVHLSIPAVMMLSLKLMDGALGTEASSQRWGSGRAWRTMR